MLSSPPVAGYLRRMLRGNPKLKPADVEASVPLLITRMVGFIHNSFQAGAEGWVGMVAGG